MSRAAAVILAASIVFCGGGEARGHASADEAAPGAGNLLTESPREVRIRFSHELDPARCALRVEDRAGTRVDGSDTFAIAPRRAPAGFPGR